MLCDLVNGFLNDISEGHVAVRKHVVVLRNLFSLCLVGVGQHEFLALCIDGHKRSS